MIVVNTSTVSFLNPISVTSLGSFKMEDHCVFTAAIMLGRDDLKPNGAQGKSDSEAGHVSLVND